MVDPMKVLQQVFMMMVALGVPVMVTMWIRATVIARRDPEASNRMLDVLCVGGALVTCLLLFGSYVSLIPA